MIGCVFDFDTVSENCKTPQRLDVSDIPIELSFLILQNFSKSSIFIAPSQIEYCVCNL